MKFLTFLLIILSVLVIFGESFTVKQLREGEEIIRSCMFKVRISPLAVNRLRKADFSKVDEKSQVSLKNSSILSVD